MTHRYSESGGGFCGICDDPPGQGEHGVLAAAAAAKEKMHYTIRELQERSHQQSKDKGFHDYQPTSLREIAALNAERVALFHSEASEMLEEQRKGYAPDYTYYSHTVKESEYGRVVKETTFYYLEQEHDPEDGRPMFKPEGQASEAADMVIRVMDWAGANGVDLQAAIIEKLDYNATRAKMHGGKKF